MKTSDLIGPALDWAVVFAEANGKAEPRANYWLEKWVDVDRRYLCESASTDWSEGGPIIERNSISVVRNFDTGEWLATKHGQYGAKYYPSHSPLIAAMRCYVASKLGDEVEIPEELK